MFIIADVGSNYESFTDLKDSVTLAKNCGANAVKFQWFTRHDLYGYGDKEAKINLDNLALLKDKADKTGIEFMCSVFNADRVKDIDPLVKRHKVASSELNNPDLLKEIDRTGKPVILSIGGATMTDIKMALSQFSVGDKLTLLYCVSAYPSIFYDLFYIDKLRREFPTLEIGFSDHSLGIYAAISAAKHFNVQTLEKHFKLREMNTPDSNHSLNPSQFKLMVKRIMGEADPIHPAHEEREFILKSKRRLMAINPVKQGNRFIYGTNFGAYRSVKEDANGLSPYDINRVHDRSAARDIQAGESIGPKEIC